VLLRWILDEAGQLDPSSIDEPLTSALAEVEIFRTLDRLRLRAPLSPQVLATLHGSAIDLLARIRVVQVSPSILARAAQPFPTPIRTLDAIHLATVLLWREQHNDENMTVATHDQELGLAAKAFGLAVQGI
jgi:hypothetical protein